jgi:hypothetical protein
VQQFYALFILAGLIASLVFYQMISCEAQESGSSGCAIFAFVVRSVVQLILQRENRLDSFGLNQW